MMYLTRAEYSLPESLEPTDRPDAAVFSSWIASPTPDSTTFSSFSFGPSLLASPLQSQSSVA
ncbi:hypothetical protein RJ640_020935 [Escallonia rubra]|uniref:Uncharacterized protein n=1 Tax=Escallonia rubra TaxID=112253 RepID=A0AA88RRA0_9ASTE|nr:hypothetical protein RJ640_020935 [Escallonia rubra]